MHETLVQELSRIENVATLHAWKHIHGVSVELLVEAMAAVRQFLENADFDPADRLSEWCVLLVEDAGSTIIKARVMVTRGIVLARLNEHARAIPFYDGGLHIYEQEGEELLAAKVRMNRVSSYSHLSRYEEALHDAEISDQVFTRLGETFLLAMNCNNLGEVLFRLDRFQDWLATLDRAEKLLSDVGDAKSLAMVYMNHAVVFTSLNKSSEAFRYYELSKQAAERSGQTYIAACCDYNLGYLHYVQGNYTKALTALSETRRALPDHRWYRPLCDLTESEIYLEMNMYRDAIRLAKRAFNDFEATEKPFEMAKAVGIVAVAHSQLGEFREAETAFKRATSMFHAQGNVVRAATMDLYRGVMWLQLGRCSEARHVAQEAFEAFMKEDVKPKAAYARVISARASLNLADVGSASTDAAAASALDRESPMPWVSHQVHAVLGEIHLAQNELQNACIEFRNAIDQLEGVRANITADELRLNYLKDKVPVYEMLLNTDLQLGDDASLREAFETTERARSRTLVDLLAGSIESLRHVTWASVDDVQAALDPDAALVEYFMSGDTVTAFCLSPQRFEIIQDICSRSDLKKRFDFLQFHFSRFAADPVTAKARGNMALLNIQDHLEKLYGMLVQPLEGFLSDRKSLVVVPFGFLHYLPFHALFDGSHYLTDRFGISYAPAASLYRLFKKKSVDLLGKALLIGVPDERAPFIFDEIDSIQSALPNAQSLIAHEATLERVTREMAAAPLIHIASHATFRPDNPMFSSIQMYDSSLNFFDVYGLRTSASLITLSGCGTGLSTVVAGDELLGLVRGFLYAGATSVVLSLWDVNDHTTADLMKYFYGCLSAGNSKSQSLRLAMSRVREEHPHPYYWAPFLLMGDAS